MQLFEQLNKAIIGVGNTLFGTQNKNIHTSKNKLTNTFSDNINVQNVSGGLVKQTIAVGGGGISEATGFSVDITFSAVDNNTVQWEDGTIYMSNGDVYTIPSGNTGDMSDITYIYLDKDNSILNTTTDGSVAVANGHILIGTAGPVDSSTGANATFQIMGNNGQAILVTADAIAAGTITGNKIQANTLTSTQINTSSINIGDWSGDLDDVDNGSTYKRVRGSSLNADGYITMDTITEGNTYKRVKSTAVNSDGLIVLDNTVDGTYKRVLGTYVNAGKIKLVDNDTGIVLDADNEKLEIDNGNGEKIQVLLESGLPKIKFYDDNNYVGYLAGDNTNTTIGGTNYNVNVIKSSGDLGVGNDLFVNDDCVIGDDTVVGGKLYVYNGKSSNPTLQVSSDIVYCNGKLKIPVGEDLYE